MTNNPVGPQPNRYDYYNDAASDNSSFRGNFSDYDPHEEAEYARIYLMQAEQRICAESARTLEQARNL